SLDVSRFDTRNVTDMSSMFSSCEALKNLDLSNFVTPNLQGTSYMFQNCGALTRVDLSSLDMSGVQMADQMFTSCSALREVVLGEGFAFLPGGTRNNRLPSPTANGTYTGNWVNSENESQSFGASALSSQYDGATMAGTWVWEQWHDCALTFDLVGGSVPTGQSYPTTYRMGQALALPGTKGSSLRNPTRSGYAFLNWTDEKGKKIEKIGTDSRGPRTITASWRALQIRVSVPVAETLVATQSPDGTMRLAPEEGDFKLAVQSTGDAPVSVTAKATPAYGFSIGDSNTLSDGEADVWMTPTIAGWWASNDGYDPASDPTYQEYGEVRLSQLGAGKKIGPTLRAYDTLWLNKMGGVMGGWSNNTGAKTLLATINWTFEPAAEA
ncbi:MAG: BspA family leucine-rich repeat surface protein, partial [Atopobiaceae bacterium]|nr:BspA family leucine-rich repeat surface protein [Atopobiaceae bacterium]